MYKYIIFLIKKNIFYSKIIENIITCTKIRHFKANVDTFGGKKDKKRSNVDKKDRVFLSTLSTIAPVHIV